MNRRLTLHWNSCVGNIWCPLGTVNLDHHHFDDLYGVYIIWHWDNQRQLYVHKVGQAKDDEIRERLKAHRRDFGNAYSGYTLCVTWAEVDISDIDGVEAYLGNTLKPQDRYPLVEPIIVNLPSW